MRALKERATQTIPSAHEASATDTVGHRSPGSMSTKHSRHQPTHSHTDREAHRSHSDRIGFVEAATTQRKLVQLHEGTDTDDAGPAIAEQQTPRTSTLPARTSTAHAHLHQRSRLRDHPRRQGLAGLAGRACGDSFSASFASSSRQPATVWIERAVPARRSATRQQRDDRQRNTNRPRGCCCLPSSRPRRKR